MGTLVVLEGRQFTNIATARWLQRGTSRSRDNCLGCESGHAPRKVSKIDRQSSLTLRHSGLITEGADMPSFQLKLIDDQHRYTMEELLQLRRQMLRFARSLPPSAVVMPTPLKHQLQHPRQILLILSSSAFSLADGAIPSSGALASRGCWCGGSGMYRSCRGCAVSGTSAF